MKTELYQQTHITTSNKGLFIHLSFLCLVVVLHMRPQRKLRRAYRRVWWGLGPPRATLTPHSHEGPEVSGGGQGEQAARPRLLKSGAFWPSLHAREHNPKESEPWAFSSVFSSIRQNPGRTRGISAFLISDSRDLGICVRSREWDCGS